MWGRNHKARTHRDQNKNFIPDEAIETSDEERAPLPNKKMYEPPVDEYSSEKISPNAPSDADVKSGFIDDTVMPG
jgi:hypothetical protein